MSASRRVLTRGLLLVVTFALVTPAVARELSLEQRVEYQRRIEDVYWQHRIWPAENPGPKPALGAVLSDDAIRARVETYLKESSALDRIWQRAIGRKELQVEVDRIVRDTKDGAMLAELFRALHDDPYLIAEVLARQTLADRLVRDSYAFDARFHGALRARAEIERAAGDMKKMSGVYLETRYAHDNERREVPNGTLRLDAARWSELRAARAGAPVGEIGPMEETHDAFVVTSVLSKTDDETTLASVTWPKRSFDDWWAGQSDLLPTVEPTEGPYTVGAVTLAGCTPDTWRPTFAGAPDARTYHVAVWTGSEMIVWGGGHSDGDRDTGGRYNPATDTWTPTARGSAVPSPRHFQSAVWTGTAMIVWGGHSSGSSASVLNTGGRYDPASDTWAPIATVNAPEGRDRHTAVWTGQAMIVWGGVGAAGSTVNTGARYIPLTDTWVAIGTVNAPSARYDHSGVWTGSQMIVWGGWSSAVKTNTGGSYDPSSNTWSATPTGAGVPAARNGHSAVWTGTEMIVWGGTTGAATNTGARLNPGTGIWTPTSTAAGVPSARTGHVAVWTGSQMIVWSGLNAGVYENTGGRYDPGTNAWSATAIVGAPSGRQLPRAVWTGSEMIVWGGADAVGFLRTGGRYNPVANSWLATSTGANIPSQRSLHVASWSGAEMIVCGGVETTSAGAGLNTCGRYSPATDTWSATVSMPVSGRSSTTAVWTGTRMIVWGGESSVGGPMLNTGARYDPATNSWAATSLTGGPTARSYHSAVWSGTQMIVWGGWDGFNYFNSGGRYDPSTDSWVATSVAGAPTGRVAHSAVWTGTQMIVWAGGTFGSTGVNTGGRYTPATNSWTATSTTDAPMARGFHAGVWANGVMVVWGGQVGGSSGGRYDPVSDIWRPTSEGPGVPAGRQYVTAVWTGTEMIVWGGMDQLPPYDNLNTGGRYDLAADQWIATSLAPRVPSPRSFHTAVLSGDEMIVWGGAPSTNTGAVYCAAVCTPSTYFLDADGDGFGTASGTTRACSLPAGYSTQSTDCNDADPSVNPAAPEACDGIDKNCDGVGDTQLPPEIHIDSIARLASFNLAQYTWSTFPGARYDAFRGVYAGAVGSDPFNENCLLNNSLTSSWTDDGIPEGGKVWWFLVRAVNSCGDGTLGFATIHSTPTSERMLLVCP